MHAFSVDKLLNPRVMMERNALKDQDASRFRVGVMMREELVTKPLGKIISAIVPLLVLCTW